MVSMSWPNKMVQISNLAADVVHLAEWLLLIPEVHSLNPVIGILLYSTVELTKVILNV